MADVDTTFVLKVLTGPHKGAEVDLSQDRETTLGRDESCDIVLIDVGLSPTHILITTTASEIFVEPVGDSSIVIDGEVCTKRTKLNNFQHILACKTVLSIGPANVDWPEIPLEVTKKPAAIVEEKTTDIATTESSTKGSQKEKTVAAPEQTSANEHKPVAVKPKKLKKQMPWKFFALLAFSIAFLAFSAFLILQNIRKQASQPVEKVKTWHDAKDQILKKLLDICKNKEFFTLDERPNGFSVVAYAKTNADRSLIMKELREIKDTKFARISVFSQETFINSATEILTLTNPTLRIAANANLDSISLIGYIYNVAALDSIRKKLFTEVAGLRNMKVSVLSADDVYDMASNILSKYSFGGLLQLKTTSDGVFVSGIIDVRNSDELKSANKELTKIFKDICKVSTQISITTPKNINKTYFDTPITSVTVSENSDIACIYLKNGDKYFESSQLPNGYVIDKINTNGVVLTKGSEVITLRFDEL